MQPTIFEILSSASVRGRRRKKEKGVFIDVSHLNNHVLLTFHVHGGYMDYLMMNGLRIIPTRRGGGYRVHHGLYAQMKTVLPILMEYVVQCHPSLTLHFTGHSRGGALALLSAAHVANLYPRRILHVVTTGMPHVGTVDFKKWIEKTRNIFVYRIAIDEDLVPRWKTNAAYVHCGSFCSLQTGLSRFHWKKNHSREMYLHLMESWPLVPVKCR